MINRKQPRTFYWEPELHLYDGCTQQASTRVRYDQLIHFFGAFGIPGYPKAHAYPAKNTLAVILTCCGGT